MWEAYGLENEDLLWASTALQGGIGGYRKAVCGALSSSAVCLGFRHIRPLDGNEEAVEEARDTARDKAKIIAEEFNKKFGSIICEELADFGDSDGGPRDPELMEKAIENNCIPQVQFCTEKLYELDER
jgi:C_GCAxxG_C_C family probable redox protein